MVTEVVRIEDGTAPRRALVPCQPVLFRIEIRNPTTRRVRFPKNLGTEATALELMLEAKTADRPPERTFAVPGWRPFGAPLPEDGEYAPGENLVLYRSYSCIVLTPPLPGVRIDHLCQAPGSRTVRFALRAPATLLGNPMVLRVEEPDDQEQAAIDHLLAHDLPEILDPMADRYLLPEDRKPAMAALRHFLDRFGKTRFAPWARIGRLRLLLVSDSPGGAAEEAQRFLADYPRSPLRHLVSFWLASAHLAADDLEGAARSLRLSEACGRGMWRHQDRIRELRRELARRREDHDAR
jgi:hypothetical protein